LFWRIYTEAPKTVWLGSVTVTSQTGDRKVPGLTPSRGTVR